MTGRKKYVTLATAFCIKLRLDPDLDRNQGLKNTRLLNRLLLTQTKKKKYKDRFFYGYNSNRAYLPVMTNRVMMTLSRRKKQNCLWDFTQIVGAN